MKFYFSRSLVLAVPACFVSIRLEKDIRHPVRRSSHLFADDIQINSRAEIIYEDALQIAVKNQPEDAAVITKGLQYQI